MRDVLETIAQQIDHIAAKPWEAAFYAAGSFACWQWLGWWGVAAFLGFLVLIAFAVDVTVYVIAHRQTYAKYRDTTLWMSGFHPFKARAMARQFDRAIKEHGEEKVIADLAKLGATVTHRKEHHA